jgi:hypothetical protein
VWKILRKLELLARRKMFSKNTIFTVSSGFCSVPRTFRHSWHSRVLILSNFGISDRIWPSVHSLTFEAFRLFSQWLRRATVRNSVWDLLMCVNRTSVCGTWRINLIQRRIPATKQTSKYLAFRTTCPPQPQCLLVATWPTVPLNHSVSFSGHLAHCPPQKQCVF